MLAGVRTELISYPAACHGFQMVPGTQLAERFAGTTSTPWPADWACPLPRRSEFAAHWFGEQSFEHLDCDVSVAWLDAVACQPHRASLRTPFAISLPYVYIS